MFEEEPEDPSRYAEIIARFDRLFARFFPADTNQTRSLVARIGAASRMEAQAAAARLGAIGELYAARLREFGESQDWAVDTTEVVTAEVAAELRISQGLAGSYLRYACAMRERLPRVGEVFRAGGMDYRMFQTLVFRTELITDPEVLAAVDGQLAVAVPRWPSLTQGRLAAAVDQVVARADRDAVRRRRAALGERQVWIADRLDGLSEITATVFTPDAHAVGKRLAGLAATVCEHDPRSPEERRADATGALAAGAARLSCTCGRPDCSAGGKAAGPVVIHVLAEAATVAGTGTTPATVIGAEGLIPAEMLTELAAAARLQPLIHPADAPPEPGYTPSQALADFVRCRDLTCRFPGCDRPAAGCDVDHTIPHGHGGPTQASNLKCLCRLHHLIKTFWGWRDQQLRDGTLIWTSPAGDTYVTTPGSALLFPALCAPTARITASPTPSLGGAERTAMMPKRRRTRAHNRAQRIAAERRHNRDQRLARHPTWDHYLTPTPPNPDEDPPPF
jgi:hypothetical protein